MKTKDVFIFAWGIFFAVVTVAVIFTMIAISLFFNVHLYGLLIFLPFVFAWLVWKSKIEVSPEWELIAEWSGKRMEPFKNGYYYPFKYFGFFKEKMEVPMNMRSVSILSGVRDGLSKEVIDEYCYGTAVNVAPGTGDLLRLLYRVEFTCKDSSKLAYSMEDAYEYLAIFMEKKVSSFVHSKNSEEIIDKFTEQDLSSIGGDIKDCILNEIGLEISSFIPIGVIYSPEVKELRDKEDAEKRKGPLIELENENKAKIEAGKEKILKARLINMEQEKKIADEQNSILKNRISAIQATAGVTGADALHFLNKQKTLETVAESAQNGNVVYIDENSQGAASQGAALGFGINATKK